MNLLQQADDGIVLLVKAVPGASRAEIRGIYNGMLKVAVTQVAEKGKANQAVLRLVAKQLDLKRSQIALVRGETVNEKQFLVSSISIPELAGRVSKCCELLE